MRQLWLLFAQSVTVVLALYFVYVSTSPEWGGRIAQRMPPASTASAPATLPGAGLPVPGSYRDAAGRAMPAVVNILTSQTPQRANNALLRDPFFKRFFERHGEQEKGQASLGSGVIVSADGYILTNNHVVESADEIEVVLADGRRGPAKVVGLDPETDLAVIRVNLGQLPVMALGQIDEARVGDVVLAIGNPFGVGQTVTMGIISALGRNNLHINHFENFIQTDAAINFGNSGGALIDVHGNMLGINSAIYSQSGGSVGIGFAIPVSTAKSVMDAIIKSGHVVRGWIGVESQEITPELADSFGLSKRSGAIIAGVIRNGPADHGGMKPGDILLTVAGNPVADTNAMLNLIAQLQPNQKTTMTVLRKGSVISLDIMVSKRP